MDVIKWYFNFVLCNFGVKLYLRFQIKLALCAHSISNHAWDLRPKCTPLSSVNISNRKSHMLLKWHKHILKVLQNMNGQKDNIETTLVKLQVSEC